MRLDGEPAALAYRTPWQGEAHLSAEHPSPREDARLPGADGDEERPNRAQAPPGEGPQAADGRPTKASSRWRADGASAWRPRERIRRRPEFERVYDDGRPDPRPVHDAVRAAERRRPRRGSASRPPGSWAPPSSAIAPSAWRARCSGVTRSAAGLDIVIVPRREMLDAPFASLEADYHAALDRRDRERPRPARRPRAVAAVVLALLRAYKLLISPLFAGCCRFQPSCSDYMAEAVRTHGAVRGVWLGLRRLVALPPASAATASIRCRRSLAALTWNVGSSSPSSCRSSCCTATRRSSCRRRRRQPADSTGIADASRPPTPAPAAPPPATPAAPHRDAPQPDALTVASRRSARSSSTRRPCRPCSRIAAARVAALAAEGVPRRRRATRSISCPRRCRADQPRPFSLRVDDDAADAAAERRRSTA